MNKCAVSARLGRRKKWGEKLRTEQKWRKKIYWSSPTACTKLKDLSKNLKKIQFCNGKKLDLENI